MQDKEKVLKSLESSIDGLTNLPEYQEANELLNQINPFLYKFPSHLIDQLSRSSLSILNNISEGYGITRGRMINFYLIARGSAYETYAMIHAFQLPKDKIITLIKHIEERIKELANDTD